MKTTTCLWLLLLLFSGVVNAQPAKVVSKPSVKTDGIYECREWEFIDNKIETPVPAYYRFFADGSLLFCHYQNLKEVNKDSMATIQDIFQTVLTQATLDKIKENMADDPANVYKVYDKFKITAYKYQLLPNGICFDILSERPNCLGKPNMKVPESTLIKTDNGNPADDRYFKFVPVN